MYNYQFEVHERTHDKTLPLLALRNNPFFKKKKAKNIAKNIALPGKI